MIEIRYCASCYPILQKTGIASLVYEKICEFVAIEKIPYLVGWSRKRMHEHEVIKFLELKGFIISTEFDFNHILVKPTGHDILEDGYNETHLFCKNSICCCDE